ncbi:MAG: nuclear transport factor 2 family protein [Paludibacteraceae bacterium]|nr:nuclear transport factor 2 family protein [Paludibacteraceae bacterium]
MTEEQQISSLYERMYTAMIAKDEAVLREVHAEDFVLVHMTGMHQNREQYIRAIMDGTLNYYSAETEDLQISVNGDEATLRGRSRVNAAVFGGGRHTWRLELLFRLRKERGAWRFTRSEASTY